MKAKFKPSKTQELDRNLLRLSKFPKESPSVYKSLRSILTAQKSSKKLLSSLPSSPRKSNIPHNTSIKKQHTKSFKKVQFSPMQTANITCSLEELKNENIEDLKRRKFDDLKQQLQLIKEDAELFKPNSARKVNIERYYERSNRVKQLMRHRLCCSSNQSLESLSGRQSIERIRSPYD